MSEQEPGGGGHEKLEDLGIGTWCLALTVGIFARSYLSKVLPIPYTVVLLTAGLLIGFLLTFAADVHVNNAAHEHSRNIFVNSISTWVNISPEAIIFAILPILIFEASFSANLFLFYKALPAVLVMAVPVVVLNSLTVAFVCSRLLNYGDGWDFSTAFLLGSILSPTDTVAPMAILKELGAPESLQLIVEGESLLNDGSALVLFTLARGMVLSNTIPTGLEAVRAIARLSLIGPIIGLALGALASYVLGYILNDPLAEITTTLVVGYGSFVLAESTGLYTSGVLAMVIAGLFMSFYGRGRVSARVRAELNSFWAMLGYVANSLVFFISGLQMVMRGLDSQYIQPRDYGYCVGIYLLMNGLRFVGVFLAYPVLSRGAYGIDKRQAAVLSYAGLRGAVGLTLAIAIHQDEGISHATRDRILFHTAGVSLLSLLINGTTLRPFIAFLGLNRESAAEQEVHVRTSLAIEQRLEAKVAELKRDPFLGDADWRVVFRYVPCMTEEVYWWRFHQGHLQLSPWEAEFMSQQAQAWWQSQQQQHTQQQSKDGSSTTPLPPPLPPLLGGGGQQTRSNLTTGVNSGITLSGIAGVGWGDKASHEQQQPATMAAATPRGLMGVPSRLRAIWRGYARKFNALPTPEHEGLRQIRTGLLEAWRNRLLAEEHLEHEQDEAETQQQILMQQHHRRQSTLDRQEGQQQQQQGQQEPIPPQTDPQNPLPPPPPVEEAGEEGGWTLGTLHHNSHSSNGGGQGAAPAGGARRFSNVTQLWEPEIEGLGLTRMVSVQSAAASITAGGGGGGGGGTNSLLGIDASFPPQHHLRHRGGGGGSTGGRGKGDSGSGPAPLISPHILRKSSFDEGVHMAESLMLARLRVLTILKHLYGASFHCGLLSNAGLQALEKNVFGLLSKPHEELQEWATLEANLWIPMGILRKAKRYRKLRYIGPLVRSFMFGRLAFLFELAVNFLKAHQSLQADLPKILGPGVVTAIIAREVAAEAEAAEATIQAYLPIFPETFNSAKTEMVASCLLNHYRGLLEEGQEMGILTEKHFHDATEQCDRMTHALRGHAHSESSPSYAALLSHVGFLRFCSPSDLDALFAAASSKAGSTKRKLCADVYLKANKKLLKKGASPLMEGWYVVVRGSVAAGGVILPHGATLGMVELLLGEPVCEDHVTTTLTHLLFFDKAAILQEAEGNPALLKSIWWYLAVHALHKQSSGGYDEMELGEVGELLAEADFLHLPPAPPSPPGHLPDGGVGSTRAGSSLRGLLSLVANPASLRGLPLTPRTSVQQQQQAAASQSFAAQYGASSFAVPGEQQPQQPPPSGGMVLDIPSPGRDVLIMAGGLRLPPSTATASDADTNQRGTTATTPRNSSTFAASVSSYFWGHNGNDRTSTAAAASAAAVDTAAATLLPPTPKMGTGALGGSSAFSSLLPAARPQLLERVTGELALRPGTIAFLLPFPKQEQTEEEIPMLAVGERKASAGERERTLARVGSVRRLVAARAHALGVGGSSSGAGVGGGKASPRLPERHRAGSAGSSFGGSVEMVIPPSSLPVPAAALSRRTTPSPPHIAVAIPPSQPADITPTALLSLPMPALASREQSAVSVLSSASAPLSDLAPYPSSPPQAPFLPPPPLPPPPPPPTRAATTSISTAQTVTLKDFLEAASGGRAVDVEAARAALAGGEGLASLLTRQLADGGGMEDAIFPVVAPPLLSRTPTLSRVFGSNSGVISVSASASSDNNRGGGPSPPVPVPLPAVVQQLQQLQQERERSQQEGGSSVSSHSLASPPSGSQVGSSLREGRGGKRRTSLEQLFLPAEEEEGKGREGGGGGV